MKNFLRSSRREISYEWIGLLHLWLKVSCVFPTSVIFLRAVELPILLNWWSQVCHFNELKLTNLFNKIWKTAIALKTLSSNTKRHCDEPLNKSWKVLFFLSVNLYHDSQENVLTLISINLKQHPAWNIHFTSTFDVS